MKTLQLNQKNFSIRSMMLLILLLIATTIFSQHKNDSTRYLPQISLTATNGFGPYIIGTMQENTFTVSDLPEETSKVILRFIDADSIQIGSSHIETGISLTSVSWSVHMDSLNLPLSPQFNIEITYKTDSIAKYYIAYAVYPDTIHILASEGWGPFITNDYPLSDTLWQPVSELYNTFSISNLPPRTDSIKFEIVNADSTIIDSLYVYSNPGQFLDTATFPNVRMDQLPLSTRYLRSFIWCNGGPKKGIEFHKSLSIIPQKPKLICYAEGVTLQDSIGTFIQNQIAGNALLVDSAKHAVITNGPGRYFQDGNINGYRGPYSFNVIEQSFTIEAWLKFDLEIMMNNGACGRIGSVENVWELYIESGTNIYGDIVVDIYFISLAEGQYYELFAVKSINFELFQGSEWHHIAFVQWGQYGSYSIGNFYLDGNQLPGTTLNYDNFNLIKFHTNYLSDLKTQPLFLSGWAGSKSGTDSEKSDNLITAMDEVRIWQIDLSSEVIKANYKRTILQDSLLVGYWNFDDERNRLGKISDISYKNNSGEFKNGATFIPQYPHIQITMDTLNVTSSNALTDSIVFSFIDANNKIVDSDTLLTNNGKVTIAYDISSLPYEISHLRINEYYPGVGDTGFITNYNLDGWAPSPIATPFYNWNTYYHIPDNIVTLNNPITVSDFPENTEKVILGLSDKNTLYDTVSYIKNTIPYQYSLTLNGTDNYIETSQKVLSPSIFNLSLWFKTSTKKGGKIIGFTKNQNGITNDYYDRGLYMETDGSLRFRLDIMGAIRYMYAVNTYNDGIWHHVTVSVSEDEGVLLYMDDCNVDYLPAFGTFNYEGYWVIGRSNISKDIEQDSIAEYFEGSLCEIKIEDLSKGYSELNNISFPRPKSGNGGLYYKLDEGSGTSVNDSQGNNSGEIKGSPPNWSYTDKLSSVKWSNHMINKQPGVYTFFAKVFYPGGPDTGMIYPLGRYQIKDPFPGEYFAIHLPEIGYYNEGTQLITGMDYFAYFTYDEQYNWKDNFFQFSFLSPDHIFIFDTLITFTSNNSVGFIAPVDFGEAPPGSYFNFQFGYHTSNNIKLTENTYSVPIYINPMIPPIVSGNFGPFDQAIAPGTMQKEKTFIITTEILSDLNKVTGKFYNDRNEEIGSAEAEKMNETTWLLTYDMATLSPPVTQLKIEYYLGANEILAMIQGPFKIAIHKTRPDWFDFIPDENFTDVNETEDNVTFNIVTTFVDHNFIDEVNEISIPSWVPFIGSTSSKINTPTSTTSLLYEKKSNSLTLSGPPEITHKIYNLGTNDVDIFNFSFHNDQYDSYHMDDENNLYASQNFSLGGDLSSVFNEIESIVEPVEDLIDLVEDLNPEDFIIKPDFSVTFTGNFYYSARTHLKVDTLSGRWGSIGNLDVDANHNHPEAYQNSASFQFYSGTFGVEFGVGIKVFEGLYEGDFDTDIRIGAGFGQSYITIPHYKSKFLKSIVFQNYGKFVVKVFWDWYEKTVWGPEMFYSTKLWGDDMSSAFPLPDKQPSEQENIETNTSWPELITGFIPVSGYSKIPLAYPEQTMDLTDNLLLVSWVDKGNTYGERDLMFRYLDRENKKFSDKIAIATNNHAISTPTSVIANENTLFFAWTQSRHTNQSISELLHVEVLNNFAQSNDIYYAVYNIDQDTITHLSMIADDLSSIISGRTEGNPEVTALSNSRVMLTWLVVDPEEHKSEIWYSIAEKQGNEWVLTEAKGITEIAGIETDINVVSPTEDNVVLVWMNINKDGSPRKRILTSIFNGEEWSQPAELFDQSEHHKVNTLDVNFNSGFGAAIWTSFVTDSLNNQYETLSLIPWDPAINQWNSSLLSTIYTDSIYHLSYPEITVSNDGRVAIAVKSEQIITKTENSKISQVNLFMGNINNPGDSWEHFPCNEYICDTTKQISDLALSFNGQDSLMLLSQEFVLQATTARFEPSNGIIFGDPYMNLVLRSFKIEDHEVEDINENEYFVDINEIYSNESDVKLYQNFPNPCIDQTTIRFYIPHDSHINLEAYNMTGFMIAVLIDQRLTTGPYEVRLNTLLLDPGTYIYKLTTDDSISTLRMIVSD